MTEAVLVAGLTAIALGGIAAVSRTRFTSALALQGAGAVAVAAAGFLVLAADDAFGAEFSNQFAVSFGVDGLSGLFLGTLGLIGAPTLLFSVRYLQPTPRGRATGVLMAAFLLSLAMVVCARDPISFLGGWELMTLISGAVIIVAGGGGPRPRPPGVNKQNQTHHTPREKF